MVLKRRSTISDECSTRLVSLFYFVEGRLADVTKVCSPMLHGITKRY